MEHSLAWCGGVEWLWVDGCVVGSRQRVCVIGFFWWRWVSLEHGCQTGTTINCEDLCKIGSLQKHSSSNYGYPQAENERGSGWLMIPLPLRTRQNHGGPHDPGWGCCLSAGSPPTGHPALCYPEIDAAHPSWSYPPFHPRWNTHMHIGRQG